MGNKNPSPNTRFNGAKVDGNTGICVKFPTSVDSILRSLPNRSAKIREWVIEAMLREGLMEQVDSQVCDDKNQ